MTAPKPGPLDVECPKCGSLAGDPCLVYFWDIPMISRGERKPHAAHAAHAARIRAALAPPPEDEKNGGEK